MWTGTAQAQEKGTRSFFLCLRQLCLHRPGSHVAYACAYARACVLRVNQPVRTRLYFILFYFSVSHRLLCCCCGLTTLFLARKRPAVPRGPSQGHSPRRKIEPPDHAHIPRAWRVHGGSLSHRDRVADWLTRATLGPAWMQCQVDALRINLDWPYSSVQLTVSSLLCRCENVV